MLTFLLQIQGNPELIKGKFLNLSHFLTLLCFINARPMPSAWQILKHLENLFIDFIALVNPLISFAELATTCF